MKKYRESFKQKIKQAPMLWMLYIVAFSSLLCNVGIGVREFATTTGMALFGYSLSIVSFLFLYKTLRFYIKYDLAK